MFKNFLGGEPAKAAGSGRFGGNSALGHGPARWFGRVAPAVILLGVMGCATVKPLPQINLKAPGWTVRQGQAVWRLAHGSRDIAGDLIVAARPDGEAFVQFSKTPFPLVVARETAHQWQVEFPPQNKHYSGRGTPPKRVIWLYLPRVLAGQPPPPNWTWHQDSSGWRLENRTTGESLEGYFLQ